MTDEELREKRWKMDDLEYEVLDARYRLQLMDKLIREFEEGRMLNI